MQVLSVYTVSELEILEQLLKDNGFYHLADEVVAELKEKRGF